MTITDIARELGVSRATVYNRAKKDPELAERLEATRTRPLKIVSVALSAEQRAWLEATGNASATVRQLIDEALSPRALPLARCPAS